MTIESHGGTVHIAGGEILDLQLAGAPTTGAELGQTIAEVGHPIHEFAGANKTDTVSSIEVIGILAIGTATILAYGIFSGHRRNRR